MENEVGLPENIREILTEWNDMEERHEKLDLFRMEILLKNVKKIIDNKIIDNDASAKIGDDDLSNQDS